MTEKPKTAQNEKTDTSTLNSPQKPNTDNPQANKAQLDRLPKLCKRRKAFVYYKARGFSNVEAIKKAGYKPKDDFIASQMGSKLLQKVNVQIAIEEEKLNIFDKNMITEEYILNGLNKIAQEGRQEANRVRAWELLGKSLALFTEKVINKGDSTITLKTQQLYNKLKERGIDPLELLKDN